MRLEYGPARGSTVTHDRRGQAHTLEGIIAGLLVLSAIAFALQVTAVTPLSASTSNQHIQNQQRAAAAGVLTTAADSGALERAVLYWNESRPAFHDATVRQGYSSAPPTEFGEILEATFDRRGIAYNVDVSYRVSDGTQRQVRMVHQGVPSDSAVRATREVVLTDDDALYWANGTQSSTSVADTDSYFAGSIGDPGLYNVLRVEVIVWRI